MATPDRDTTYTNDPVRTAYTRESSGTGWFVGIIVVLALLAIGYLVFSANSGPAPTVDATTTAPAPAIEAPADTMAPAPMTEAPAPMTEPAPVAPEAPAVETAPAAPAPEAPAAVPGA